MTTAQLLKEKRERRSEIKGEVDVLTAKIEARTWDDKADKPKMDALAKEADSLESEISALETQLDMQARSAGWKSETQTQTAPAVNIIKEGRMGDTREKLAAEFSNGGFGDVVKRMYETGGGARLDGAAGEISAEGMREMREAGSSAKGNFHLPGWLAFGNLNEDRAEKRDMLVGTTTAGGFTVQTDVGRLIPLLDPRPIVRRVGATFYTGLVNNIDFPRNDAGASAAWETEVATADETSPTFDRVQMAPNRLAAFTDVSEQLMIQSTINIQQFVINRLNQAISNALDVAAFSGNGGNITGLNGESGVNLVSFLSSPTWAKIVQMETEVAADDADFGNLAYILHPRTAGIMKTIERTSTNGQYLMSGPNNGQGTVNGYNAVVSSLVYSPSTNVYSAYFGNWAKMLIGQWGGISMLINPYTKGKEATTEIITNSFWDVAVEHGTAFAIGQNIHTS